MRRTGRTTPRRTLLPALLCSCCVSWLISGGATAVPAADSPESARTASPVRHSGLTPLPDRPAVVLCSDTLPPAPVLYAKEADRQARLAAAQLAEYLSTISGQSFAATALPEELPERAIVVGVVDSEHRGNLSREGFRFETTGSRLTVTGGSPRAALYAVFALLEEQLGCRWWSHTEEFVPRRKTLQVAAQQTHIEPAFRIHDLYNREGQSATNHFVYKRRAASGTGFTGVHNLCPMLKPYAAEHPEFLPMDRKGQRKFNNIHMNYTAAGMSEIVAEELARQVERHKGNLAERFYVAGMGDWYGGMDFSPASQQVYREEEWTDPDGRKKPGYCATMLRMVNRAAELLEQQHPGVTVATHAYMSLEAPPANTRPRENVVVEIPRLRHDTVRSVEESEGNASFRRNLERWCEIAPGRVYIWEYGTNFNNFLKPFPCLRSLAANLKLYHRLGVAGVRIQGNYVSYGGDLAALKNYVWGHLLWDPSRDPDELLREFCEGYYGPAAGEMLAYVNLLEDAVRGETPVSADEFEKDFTKWMQPEIVEQAETLLKAALAKTGGDDSDDYYRRVQEARVSLEAFHLWTTGELVERDGRLIRADFDADTLPRARELVRYCRDASPREWGNGRAYRISFLATHGGPLPVLEASGLKVKVAPLQGGEIRQVLLGDTVAIDSSRERLDPGTRIYELTDQQPNSLTMQAELGIAHWGSNTKQLARRTVSLASDGTLTTSTGIQLLPGIRQKTNRPAVETVFHCDDRPDRIQIEYRQADGTWTTVSVNAQQPKGTIPLAGQLKITRTDRRIVIHDEYHGTGTPTATVEYQPATKTTPGRIVLTVLPGEIEANPETMTSGVERKLRVVPLEPAS